MIPHEYLGREKVTKEVQRKELNGAPSIHWKCFSFQMHKKESAGIHPFRQRKLYSRVLQISVLDLFLTFFSFVGSD